MSYTVVWVGHELNAEKHADKIWGYMKTDSGGVYTFWAGRGKAIQFKRMNTEWQAVEVQGRKEGRYLEKSIPQMSTLWPEFTEHLESCYAMAKLSGKIRTDE
jgi:hypothetical protein